jgi:mannose-6-phosphate isomerase
MRPFLLPPNSQSRFYRGGARIAKLRGLPPTEDHGPEDWVGSTNTVFAGQGEGLSVLPDGRVLRDAVRADPESFLGPEHVNSLGPDPGLLVKLLDAGERLPVHFHPGRAFAREALGSEHGKTEAWVIVSADADAVVYVGFRSDVDTGTVRAWIARQDGAAMLAALHRVPVAAGDALLVPGGTPHAIGAGILLVELQEPTDFSMLMEMDTFGLGDDDVAHLGVGWERALDALDTSGWDDSRLAAMRGRPRPVDGRAGALSMLPVAADPYFRAERLLRDLGAELDAGFSILVVLRGNGVLAASDGSELPVRRGSTVLVPHAAGRCRLSGALEAVRCRPGDPRAGEGGW